MYDLSYQLVLKFVREYHGCHIFFLFKITFRIVFVQFEFFFFYCRERSGTISSSKWVCNYAIISQSSNQVFEIFCSYISAWIWRSFISDLSFSTSRSIWFLVSPSALLGIKFDPQLLWHLWWFMLQKIIMHWDKARHDTKMTVYFCWESFWKFFLQTCCRLSV